MTRVRPSQLADGDSILASRPFEFFIGTNERLFTMHSALVAHHSQPLHALVHGKMLESNQGKAHLADVDEHTFVRFSEFAYSGDYTPAEPEILLKTSDIDHAPVQLNNALSEEPSREPLPVPEPEQPPDFEVVPPAEPPAPAWDEWGVAPKKSKTTVKKSSSQSKKSKLWGKFKQNSYSIPLPRVFVPPKNHEGCEDFTKVFLGHARLYVFAEKWDIEPLREISLHKLQQTLISFTLFDERVGNVVELLTYAYDNEHTRDRQACSIEDLSKNDQFQTFLNENGAFGRDLVEKLIERLD